MGGTAIKRLTVKKIKESRIPVAPFNEQRRIVERIEELLSDLDAGVAALERAKENLTRYRAAVLKAAVEGRLTEQWRAEHPSVEPASKLLKFILAEHRRKWEDDQLAKRKAQGREPSKYRQDKHKGPSSLDTIGLPPLPKAWCWATVDQLAIVVRGASPPPAGDPRYFGGNAIPWITVGSLTADDQPYLYEVHEFLTEEGRQKSRYIEADTLLLTNSGATLDVPKITMIGGCINDGSVALLGVDYPLKLYLYYFLASQTERIRAINQGVAQSNLNTEIVKAITVPLPPVREQSAIIEIIEERLSVSNKTKIQLERDLKRAAYLRQSILKRAFEGKLLSQDQNNEPASVLLEHIKAEKSVQGKQVKPRHTGRRTRIVKFKGAKRSLLDVIRENPSGITPEELLASANYSIDEVDLFYARLAEIKGDIVEQKPSGLEARKWPYEAKVILRSKG